MDIKKRMQTYEDLINLSGIGGHERAVRNYLKNRLVNCSDEIIQDRLGSIFGIKYGPEDGPIVMIAGHMDEVGAMVVGITANGFIKMQPVGSVVPEVFLSQNMRIDIGDGKFIYGVIGATPPHSSRGTSDGNKRLSFDDLLLDIGADSKEHAEELGVRIGQQITPVTNYYITADNKKVVAKAWDNRFGCGMALEIMEAAKGMDLPFTLVAGATVQEEVGLRGAFTSSQMIEPDLFIALDVSPVGDFLDPNHPAAFGKLGEGFLVRFYDPRCIMHNGLRLYFNELASKNNIKHQNFLSMGGTDAAAAQYAKHGTLSTTIGLPGRYIHSTATMIHVDDVEAVRAMLLAILKDFNKDVLERIKQNV